MKSQEAERPDLAAWRKRHELRRSGAATRHRGPKDYRRKDKHCKQDKD